MLSLCVDADHISRDDEEPWRKSLFFMSMVITANCSCVFSCHWRRFTLGFAPLVISLRLALFISLPALGISLSRLVDASAMNTVQANQTPTSKFSAIWLLLIFPFFCSGMVDW